MVSVRERKGREGKACLFVSWETEKWNFSGQFPNVLCNSLSLTILSLFFLLWLWSAKMALSFDILLLSFRLFEFCVVLVRLHILFRDFCEVFFFFLWKTIFAVFYLSMACVCVHGFSNRNSSRLSATFFCFSFIIQM